MIALPLYVYDTTLGKVPAQDEKGDGQPTKYRNSLKWNKRMTTLKAISVFLHEGGPNSSGAASHPVRRTDVQTMLTLSVCTSFGL